jgi:hypothetical protein
MKLSQAFRYIFSSALFSFLAMTMSPLAAQSLVVKPPDNNAESMSSIVALPREEAIATALQPEYEDIRPGILNIIFRLWSMEDPASAYSGYQSLPTLDYSYLIETQILQQWLRSDLEIALNIAAQSAHEESFRLVLRDAAYIDPVATLSYANTYSENMGRGEWRAVIDNIASNDPQLAAQQVAAMKPEGEYLIESFIYNLAREDSVASIQWLVNNYPNSTEYLEAIASIFYIKDSAAAFEYISRIPAGPLRDSYEQALLKAQEINKTTTYQEDMPYWVSMIDACIENGVSRNDCIES